MIGRLAEYGLAIGFPVLVLILAFTMYPVDYYETRIPVSGDDLQATGNIPTLVVASGYRSWVIGYGVVEDVEARVEESIYILEVDWEDEEVKVVLVNPSSIDSLDLKSLKGSTIVFYGPQVEYKDERIVMARVLVTGVTDTHDMHYMCIHKSTFSEKCEEIMEKHSEMMEKMRKSRRSND